jgi:hypothetical protein
VDALPLTAREPLQPPLATQAVALLVLQVSVELPPLLTAVGFAVSVTSGATTTVALPEPVPPVPVQVSVKVVAVERLPVVAVPLTACEPPQPPLAAHEVALVVVQVSVEVPPLATEVGLAVRVTVGPLVEPVTVTVAVAELVPPVPVQVRVKLVVAVSAPVLMLPLTDCVPFQPPEAVQEVAPVLLQASVAALPRLMLVGLAVSDTVGAVGWPPVPAPVLVGPPVAESPPPPPPQLATSRSTAIALAIRERRKCGGITTV